MAGAPPEPEEDPRIERSRRVVREAALRVLAESGYGAFTIDAVAKRSGVARSTIYRHWPDKIDLIVDTFETLNRQPRPDVARGEIGPSARDRVLQLVGHLIEVFDDSMFSACMPSLLEGAERDERLAKLLHGYSDRRRAALVAAIADAREKGEVGTSVDPELAAAALAGAIFYRRMATSERLTAGDAEALVDTVLGAAPPRGG